MANERENLERKKKEQKKKERNNNLIKAGGIVLGAIGLIWGKSKGKW